MTSRRTDKVTTYVAALQTLNEQDRLRRLAPRSGIDFGSNDYLALASAPRIKNAVAAALEAGTPIGAGGCGGFPPAKMVTFPAEAHPSSSRPAGVAGKAAHPVAPQNKTSLLVAPGPAQYKPHTGALMEMKGEKGKEEKTERATGQPEETGTASAPQSQKHLA